jgi:hypothetical protein
MIPMVAAMRFGREGDRSFRLWIPLALVWLLLLPIVLLLLPLVMLACAIGDVNPFRAIGTLWNLLAGMKGLEVDVEAFQMHVF